MKFFKNLIKKIKSTGLGKAVWTVIVILLVISLVFGQALTILVTTF